MSKKNIDAKTKEILLRFQKNEITEYYVYKSLSEKFSGNNKKILEIISEDELAHYNLWKNYTNINISPNKFKIWWHIFLSKLFGVTFALKLMEKGEEEAQQVYENLIKTLPEAKSILHDEDKHEQELLKLIDEEKLNYIGSMILGVSDALVELTGAIAGLTFALSSIKMVGIAASVTGISASLSMASSSYLSIKSEIESDNDNNNKNPLKASVYTGVAYILAVFVLVFPYFIVSTPIVALAWTLVNALVIILFFTYFISVVKGVSFIKRSFEMALICLSVAGISFLAGMALKLIFDVNI
ncbi:VIT1/CCC1 transporter family protein [Candidatus Woesearchaeota archaeon]|nr:VIT1/CCC1 transporter family protein [Candidatus Woesearchaeota archaeon]